MTHAEKVRLVMLYLSNQNSSELDVLESILSTDFLVGINCVLAENFRFHNFNRARKHFSNAVFHYLKEPSLHLELLVEETLYKLKECRPKTSPYYIVSLN